MKRNLMAIKKRRAEETQFSSTERTDKETEIKIKRRGRRKRRRGERVERVGDNYTNSFRQFEMSSVPRREAYVWTDERLQELVTKFYDYVCSETTYDSYMLVLNHLREPLLLNFADEEVNDTPEDIDIIEKLSELADCYKNKNYSYFNLKLRLGTFICKKLRWLVKHERFNEYLPPSAKPMRVTVVELDGYPGKSFCWTDCRLKALVFQYYAYLQELSHVKGTTEMNGKIFLAELKRRLPYKVNIKDIRSKLTMIFHEYQCKRSGYRSFRIRIGKDVCYIFDQLVAHKDYAIFEKTDETSVKSCGTSSSKRSRTNADIRNAERKADIHRVALELEDLELNEDQIGSALFKLTNPNMQIGFWACRTRGIRRHFVLHMLNQ